MRPTSHVLRHDDRYLVVVGWDYDLETFYVYVRDGRDGDLEADPVLNVGLTPHELPTISTLVGAVSRFAPLTTETVSTLRLEATPLDQQAEQPEAALPEAG